jgi:hypothetical protein
MYLTYLFKGGKVNATRPDPVREECDIPVKIAENTNSIVFVLTRPALEPTSYTGNKTCRGTEASTKHIHQFYR